MTEPLKNISCNCYLPETGQYIVGIFKDITFVREHENYIINYGAKKDALLEMVTHNLSGPLSLSQNMVDTLESVVKDNDLTRINAHIQLIKENTGHCIQMVNDFLEEEHLVSERIHTRKNRFDVISKVNTVLERFRKAYPDYDFLLLKNMDALHTSNDDVKFLQVLNNLISNAIKWSPSQSVIEIGIKTHDGSFTITVRDHGIGIPEDLKSYLFQKYTPAARDGLRGEKSIGMGLYIVKKLVSLMNGTITFESKENEGTIFILTLPKDEQ